MAPQIKPTAQELNFNRLSNIARGDLEGHNRTLRRIRKWQRRLWKAQQTA